MWRTPIEFCRSQATRCPSRRSTPLSEHQRIDGPTTGSLLWVDVDVLESEQADVAAIHAFQQEATADAALKRIGISLSDPASRTLIADQTSATKDQWTPSIDAHAYATAQAAELKRWRKLTPAQRRQEQLDEVLKRREKRQAAAGDVRRPDRRLH